MRDVIMEAGRKAIADAKIDPAEIEAAAVGNFNAGQFTKQLHLGAFIPEIDENCTAFRPCIRKRPALPARFPLSSARNGSWADFTTRFSWSALNSRRRCRRSTAPMFSARRLIITSRNRNTATSCSRNCSARSRRFTSRNMALAGRPRRGRVQELRACRLNPLAQMREANVTYDYASQVSEKNPSVAPPLKVTDCSQITDGAAALVLVSGKYLEKHRYR